MATCLLIRLPLTPTTMILCSWLAENLYGEIIIYPVSLMPATGIPYLPTGLDFPTQILQAVQPSVPLQFPRRLQTVYTLVLAANGFLELTAQIRPRMLQKK